MEDKLKLKNYTEWTSTLEWLATNVPKQQESLFIRNAVKKEITRLEKKEKKSFPQGNQ